MPMAADSASGIQRQPSSSASVSHPKLQSLDDGPPGDEEYDVVYMEGIKMGISLGGDSPPSHVSWRWRRIPLSTSGVEPGHRIVGVGGLSVERESWRRRRCDCCTLRAPHARALSARSCPRLRYDAGDEEDGEAVQYDVTWMKRFKMDDFAFEEGGKTVASVEGSPSSRAYWRVTRFPREWKGS